MLSDIRIAIIGQAAFGERVLNSLVERGETIVAVLCPPDKTGSPIDPIKDTAIKHRIPVYQFQRLRDQKAIDAFVDLNIDLCIMAYVTDIVPSSILRAPTHGTIQYHPSLLPKHRGPSSINWPIILGEPTTGLTIFWPDEGLDTGPILLQKKIVIDPGDTVGSLYFNKLSPMGVDAIIQGLDLIKTGNPPKIAQDESQATYEGWCRKSNVIIDWSKPIDEIHNMIRGSDPHPGAWTTLSGRTVQFYRAEKIITTSAGTPGEVVELTIDGFSVSAIGGILQVRRVKPQDEDKIDAPRWVESTQLGLGTCFGT